MYVEHVSFANHRHTSHSPHSASPRSTPPRSPSPPFSAASQRRMVDIDPWELSDDPETDWNAEILQLSESFTIYFISSNGHTLQFMLLLFLFFLSLFQWELLALFAEWECQILYSVRAAHRLAGAYIGTNMYTQQLVLLTALAFYTTIFVSYTSPNTCLR